MHTIEATRGHFFAAANAHSDFGFSPEYFDAVKARLDDLEARAWKHLAKCHARMELEFDDQFADTTAVSHVVREICRSYNCPQATDGVLTSLYLKHRKHFLKIYQDFYVFDGGYFVAYPCSNGEECEMVTAYGYSGRSGANGDIVDFHSINPENIGFRDTRPTAELWEHLKLDQQLALGIINYGKVAESVSWDIRRTVASQAGKINCSRALQNLSRWLLDLEVDREGVMPAIALATHATLLHAL